MNYPPGTSASDPRAPWNASDLDEPGHPRNCAECNRFLKARGWTYESWIDEDEDGKWLVHDWSITCTSCGILNIDRRTHP